MENNEPEFAVRQKEQIPNRLWGTREGQVHKQACKRGDTGKIVTVTGRERIRQGVNLLKTQSDIVFTGGTDLNKTP